MWNYSLNDGPFGQLDESFWENPKTDCSFLGANPKKNHESIKSTLLQLVDSSDQIHIRIFEARNLSVSVFWGKDLKNVFLTSGYPTKIHDILTEPMLVAP